ncbi:hypothetical protein P8452_73401 [Trifolium repens]|nr:hypothetical protein P8452_73401 [Trifolium repens]
MEVSKNNEISVTTKHEYDRKECVSPFLSRLTLLTSLSRPPAAAAPPAAPPRTATTVIRKQMENSKKNEISVTTKHERFAISVQRYNVGIHKTIINIGDLLQLITDDKFKSVEHRVVAKHVGPRVSVAHFYK